MVANYHPPEIISAALWLRQFGNAIGRQCLLSSTLDIIDPVTRHVVMFPFCSALRRGCLRADTGVNLHSSTTCSTGVHSVFASGCQ
jgi:hypothetical protein